MFGLPGLLLAIPTITILEALVSSSSRQLKAYGLNGPPLGRARGRPGTAADPRGLC